MSLIDYLALALYLGAMIAIGLWAARRVKSMDDFVLPKRFGKIFMITFSLGTGTHADDAVSVSSKTFSAGLSGIWYSWLYLFCTPFYWLIAPVMKRFRALTTADIFEARYNKSVAMLYTIVGLGTLAVDMGVMLKGSGAIITASTRGLISANAAIIVMTVVFVFYGVAGGLSAAIITDFIQGILTIIFSIMLLPSILHAVGGLAGLHDKLPGPMFSLVAPAEIGAFYVAVIALNGLVGIVAQPYTMANCSAGRTEMDGRVGFMAGNMIKRFCTAAWCITGLAAVAYFAGTGVKGDQVWGTIAADFLPKIAPGVLGVFLAALLASVQSTADAIMITSSGLFTENIYKRLAPGKDAKHYLAVARVASLGVVALAVVFAFVVPSVIEGLEIFWKIASMMGIAFWLGLFWRKATPAGAWAATIAAFVAWGITTRPLFIAFAGAVPGAEALRFVFIDKGIPEIYLPWQILVYLASGLAAGVIVSLFTRSVATDRLENYYALARAPVTAAEPPSAPCTIPAGIEVPARRVLFPNSSLEIMVPSRVSVIGFLAGWAFVAVIIAGFYFIAAG